MSSLRRLTLAGLLSLLLQGGPVVAQALPTPKLPSDGMLAAHGLDRLWWGQATLDPTRFVLKYLTIDEDLAYAQASSGAVTAFDGETGTRLWTVQLGRRDDPSFPLVSNDRLVLVVAGTKIYAIEKWTGQVRWEVGVPAAPSAGPTADADNIYVPMVDGSLYAIDLRKVDELWKQGRLPKWSQNAVRWRLKTPRTIMSPPVTTGLVVLTTSQSGERGTLYSVTPIDRDLQFQFEAAAPASAPLVQAMDPPRGAEEGTAYVFLALENYVVYCINTLSGSVRWQFVSGVPVREAPRVIDDSVFIIPARGGMYCLARDTGSQRWWQPNVTRFTAATPNHVYASDDQGHLIILSRADGAPIDALPLPQFTVRLSNTITDRIFMATSSGIVMCLREGGIEFPLYHQDPGRRPILPEFAREGEPAEPAPAEAPASDAPAAASPAAPMP